jgi:TatD DNase family protein
VEKIVCIGTSHEDSLAARDFANTHEDVYWTYGIHPENAGRSLSEPNFSNQDFVHQKKQVSSTRLVAIGEVGLDYHYEGYDREAQIKLFEQMLQLATDNDLPVSFHVREAYDDFFPVLANFPKIRGVVHSFTDNKRVLRRILNETELLAAFI